MSEQGKKVDAKFTPTGVSWEEVGVNFRFKEGNTTYDIGLGVKFRQTEFIEEQRGGDVIFIIRMFGESFYFGPHAGSEEDELAKFSDSQRTEVKIIKAIVEEAILKGGGYEKLARPDLDETLKALIALF